MVKQITASNWNQEKQRAALGQFLRMRRDAMKPQEHGILVTNRRRAPGLLREEVAAAAGISPTWYTWLEQGRDVRASPQALSGLARALKLSHPEQVHLFRLARPDLNPPTPSTSLRGLSPEIKSLLHGLQNHPAYVFDQQWNVLAWNDSAALLFGEFDADPPWSMNLLSRMFLDQSWRDVFVDWPAVARAAVGQFRAGTVNLIGEPVFENFLDGLAALSLEFDSIWLQNEVVAPLAWQKKIRHKDAGVLKFDYMTLRPAGPDGDLCLTIYTPADRRSAKRFNQLTSC